MLVETVPIGSVTLDPANVHKHSAKNIEAIKGSLARFGQRTPVVVDAVGVIYKGNGTIIAARALNWTEIKVVRYADMTPAELTAYAIADNATQSQDYDDLALARTLDSIKRTDETLFAATSYDDARFDELIRSLGDEAIQAGLAQPVVDAPLHAIAPRWDVLVICKSEQEQRELLERLSSENRECRALIA